ncbi:MAG: MaoC family protein, partial [Deltaproteobacteria bacterium]|nr:MaoC family protein [Deltaproteobacteria bacterium]
MPLKMEMIGRPLEPTRYTYSWKDVVLYALAVGAQEDDLGFLLELRRLDVLPTFSVIPTFASLLQALDATGVELRQVLHGEQLIRLHRPIPREGTLITVPTVSGIYDVGKHAVMHMDTATRAEPGEELLFETRWTIIVRQAGSFGGQRPPAAELLEPPADRPPDFVHEMPTVRTQALLY